MARSGLTSGVREFVTANFGKASQRTYSTTMGLVRSPTPSLLPSEETNNSQITSDPGELFFTCIYNVTCALVCENSKGAIL